MSVTLTVNGTGYSFPNTADENWGTNVTDWATAVTSGMLQKAGGTFTLTSEVNFGATYGLKTAYYKSQATNPSATGIVRLGNTETVSWRNAGNTADLGLTVNASNVLQFNGTSFLYSGAASIVDADISASAAIAYSKLSLSGSIVNADVSASAAIAYSKLALTGSIVNADISASAAIAYSKLNIVDGDLTIAKTSGLQAALDSKSTASATETLTNKTISGASNTINNVSLSTGVTGTLPVGNGGTGQTTFTKGDILVASNSSTLTKLAVGSDGQVLTADSAQATGLKYSSVLTNPMSATGDIIVGGASGAATRLAAGSNGQVLSLSSGTPAWTDMGVPSGALMSYAGSSAPTGWLLCYGQAVSRTTYANLFSAISTTYGTGDGSTTFNLPDLRGRVAVGKDDMGGSAASRMTSGGSGVNGAALGSTGGSQTHTLTTSEIPSHTHTIGTSNNSSGSTPFKINDTARANVNTAVSSITSDSAGGGGAHNNTQPSIILNYIIKT